MYPPHLAMTAGPAPTLQSVKNTGFSAFEELRRNQRSWESLGFGKTRTQLSALTGANSIMETSRQLQQLTQGPALAFDHSFQVAVKPVSLQFENAFAAAVKPIIDLQMQSLAEMVRLSLPPSFFDTVRAMDTGAFARIRELSRVALAGPSFQAFESPRLDWSRQMSGLDHLVNAVQAATVAARADVAVPGEPPLQVPDWLADFYAHVRTLPPSEQRALVLNLLSIVLLIATTSIAWGTTGGTTAWFSSGGLVTAVLTFVNRLSALYEDDEAE